jgi:3-oxoacyl-[acyl-carrier protein] reductase
LKLDLDGKVALVVGASRGIGLAIARTLRVEGCKLGLAARDPAALERARTLFGDDASAHATDVTDPAAAQALAEAVTQRWGRIDILVCSAGSGASVPPGTETAAEWQRVLNVNLFTATNMITAARPFLARQGGAIVCISSICGMAALGAPIAYSAAKAALNATVRGLARPLAKENIRINAVAPGNILFEGGTWARKLADNRAAVEEMLAREVAQARLGTPEEIADLVAFLASHRASFITGAVNVADGGQLRA